MAFISHPFLRVGGYPLLTWPSKRRAVGEGTARWRECKVALRAPRKVFEGKFSQPCGRAARRDHRHGLQGALPREGSGRRRVARTDGANSTCGSESRRRRLRIGPPRTKPAATSATGCTASTRAAMLESQVQHDAEGCATPKDEGHPGRRTGNAGKRYSLPYRCKYDRLYIPMAVFTARIGFSWKATRGSRERRAIPRQRC